MALKQFLWIDSRGASCYYAAPGNIAVGAGASGTLALWQWPMWRHDPYDLNWRLEIDATNYMKQYQGRSLQVASNGTVSTVTVDRMTTSNEWDLLVYSWDYTTPGAGQLRAYWNGASAGTPVLNANAPVGTPTRLVLGPQQDTDTRGPTMISWLATWNRALAQAEVSGLWAEGHRHRLQESEWGGNLLLYAGFDGQLNADVAKGDAQFRVTGASDRYALVNDGALSQGRRVFAVGQPRHDSSESDRVPLAVPLNPTLDFGRSPYVRDTNLAASAQLEVLPGFTGDRRVGTGFLGRPVSDGDGLTGPSTFRQRVHLPSADNPKGRVIRLGPVDYLHYPAAANDVYDQWGSGRRVTVVEDALNTTTRVKTDLDSRFATGYWTGAFLTFLSGNCSGRRLKVSAYDATTRALTFDAALPAVPAAGSIGVVDPGPKLMGCRSTGTSTLGQRLPEMNMDAWLWEFHQGWQLFTDLEWQFFDVNTSDLTTPNFLRYDRGRTVLMDGAQNGSYENGACYGRPSKWDDSTLQCKILLERVEVDGPTTYQVLRRDSSGHGPEYADNFMVVQNQGQSTKVWRVRDVERAKGRPTKCVTPSLARADLTAAGTWRHDVAAPPIPIGRDEASGTVTCALVGIDQSAVKRLGYVVGSWNATTGRINWVDEAPPPGRTNPVLALSTLRTTREQDTPTTGPSVASIVCNSDGTWALVYLAQLAHPDHTMAYLLCGAPDRWSFDAVRHWWTGNPIAPIIGGPDRLSADGSGFGQWANRDADWHVLHNPYTRDPSRRYLGFARGKAVNHRGTNYGADLRPVIGLRGGDVRSLAPLPHGNTISPLVGPLVHMSECAVLGQSDSFGLYTDTAVGFTSGVYPFVSEDGVHFQRFASDTDWIPQGELSGEPTRLYPARPFQLGEKRVYYYSGGTWMNYASCRYQGEAWYQLKSSALSGMFETALMERPAEGWGTLHVNTGPGGGTITVEVIDGATERPLAGYGQAQMAPLTDGLNQPVTWSGQSLDHCTAATLRLRFTLTRPTSAAVTPRVYAWAIEDCDAGLRPSVGDVKVNGQVDPVGVVSQTPTFTWAFSDAQGWGQAAFQVIVASSREAADAGGGDLWDSGAVESAATSVQYGGAPLGENAVYHWKVRARNAKGVWSEEW